jgi:hypothetical protein
MRDVEALDSHFVAGGVKTRTGPFGRPTFAEIPSDFLGARFVELNDRAVLALDLAVDGLLAPLPELGVVRDTPLERYSRVLRQTWKLADGGGVGTFAVFNCVRADIEARALAESCTADAVDFKQKAVRTVGVFLFADGHAHLLSTGSLSPRPINRPNRRGRCSSATRCHTAAASSTRTTSRRFNGCAAETRPDLPRPSTMKPWGWWVVV